jgi:hypothetical protein
MLYKHPKTPYNTGYIDISIPAYSTGYKDASKSTCNTGYVDICICVYNSILVYNTGYIDLFLL